MIFFKVKILQGKRKPDETKRLSIAREVDQLTLDELCITISRMFPAFEKLKSKTFPPIKYLDEDGDLVTLERDEDIAHAIQLHSTNNRNHTLKIHVLLDASVETTVPETTAERSHLEILSKLDIFGQQIDGLANQVAKMETKLDLAVERKQLQQPITNTATLTTSKNSITTSGSVAKVVDLTSQLLKSSTKPDNPSFSSTAPSVPYSAVTTNAAGNGSYIAPSSHASPSAPYSQPSVPPNSIIAHQPQAPQYGATGGYASVVADQAFVRVTSTHSPSSQYLPQQPSLYSASASAQYASHHSQQQQSMSNPHSLPPPLNFSRQ